jgi:hypothetical protein
MVVSRHSYRAQLKACKFRQKEVGGLCLWINVDSRRSQSNPARSRITLRTSVRVCPKFRARREQADRYQRRCEARLPLLKDGLPDEEAAFDFATPKIYPAKARSSDCEPFGFARAPRDEHGPERAGSPRHDHLVGKPLVGAKRGFRREEIRNDGSAPRRRAGRNPDNSRVCSVLTEGLRSTDQVRETFANPFQGWFMFECRIRL